MSAMQIPQPARREICARAAAHRARWDRVPSGTKETSRIARLAQILPAVASKRSFYVLSPATLQLLAIRDFALRNDAPRPGRSVRTDPIRLPRRLVKPPAIALETRLLRFRALFGVSRSLPCAPCDFISAHVIRQLSLGGMRPLQLRDRRPPTQLRGSTPLR